MSAAGGALHVMLPAFKVGLGARLGDGDQYWSWVALDDLLAAFEWALHDEELEGVVNFTAPEPLTNRGVTRTLGHVLRRPAALAAPAFVLRRGTAGMGEEMLLASQRAFPERLEQRGFHFAFPSSRERCATSWAAAERAGTCRHPAPPGRPGSSTSVL